MTDDLDELLELKPVHASVLLVDPVELADRAGRSARGARRRANGLVAGMSAAGVLIAVAIGSLFLRPMFAMPAASTSPRVGPYPSSTPMSSFVPMNGGDGPASYNAARVAFGELSGGTTPESLCIHAALTRDYNACEATVPVTGLTWSQVPWVTAPASGGMTVTDAFVWGSFDGKTLHATTATRVEDTNISQNNPVPSPAAPTAALISCDRNVAGNQSELAPGLAAVTGVEAYWMDPENRRLMVAASGDLDAVALAIPTYWNGPACIGKLPATGPLADLLAAQKRVREAKIDGVTSVAAATYPGGVLQVNVVANVPGLRERVVAVAGDSVSLTIVPLFLTVT
jgi:hypothetical protein